MAYTLAQVVSARPWDKALFTTYSLSLTFFESIILRELRQTGCREVWIVVDAGGYQRSLMERRSQSVGQEYHLIPLSLPKGVFHPKCCYLAGGSEDTLVVGSGNLTFGGFGRNLEVVEVLVSTQEPQAFRAFADFLLAMRRRADIRCPDLAWIDLFADRALEISDSSSAPGKPSARLIHSVETPISTQLQTLIPEFGGVKHLTVLSPFHDPDGHAVLTLANATRAMKVRIALPPSGEPASFPFHFPSRWPIPVSAVQLETDGDQRPLHAKWFEWRTELGLLALTGSINATGPALLGVGNLEVGVLRFDPTGKGWAKWKPTAIPTRTQPPGIQRATPAQSLSLYAVLSGGGQLRGQILIRMAAAGTWNGALQKPNGDSLPLSVRVDGEGAFRKIISLPERFAFASALQIFLSGAGLQARGWVHNEEVLNVPKQRRLPLASILRMLNREETEEDDVALLDYFANHALEHLQTFRTSIKAQQVTDPTAVVDDEVAIELEDLRPSAECSTPDHSSSASLSPQIALDRLFSHLRRRLLGGTGRREPGHPSLAADETADTADAAEEGDDLQVEAEERVSNALEYFDDQMLFLAESEEIEESHRRAVLVLWLEVMLHMLVRRRGDKAGALAFLRRWLPVACTRCRPMDKGDSIEQHIVTAATLWAKLEAGAAGEKERQAHEHLERYWQGEVDSERALAALLRAEPGSLIGILAEAAHEEFAAVLRGILSTRTRRKDLSCLLEAANTGSPLPELPYLDQSETGRALRAELQKPHDKRRLRELQSAATACPHCFMRPCAVVFQELERERISRCSSCRWILMRLEP